MISELTRHFGVSFKALLYRLASRSAGLLTTQARDEWLQKQSSSVLHAANDPAPDGKAANWAAIWLGALRT